MDVIQIAKTAHEVIRLYNDNLPWNETSNNLKESSIDGVMTVIDNPDNTPEQQHNAWMGYKFREGWVYGEVKDSVKKTHPSLKPYKDLPESEQFKDKLFLTIVKSFLDE